MQTAAATPALVPRGRRNRQGAHDGFTLIEILIVVALIGILGAISTVNLRTALMVVKAQATASDLRIIQNAIKAVSGDCSALPVWSAQTDPGFTFQPAWATAGCWKGPYLNRWMTSTPLGGTFAYVGKSGTAPIVRIAGLDAGGAQVLAAKIQSQFGRSALSSVKKSGKTWTVDLVVREAVNVK